jgi:hypothetical protein
MGRVRRYGHSSFQEQHRRVGSRIVSSIQTLGISGPRQQEEGTKEVGCGAQKHTGPRVLHGRWWWWWLQVQQNQTFQEGLRDRIETPLLNKQ